MFIIVITKKILIFFVLFYFLKGKNSNIQSNKNKFKVHSLFFKENHMRNLVKSQQ